MRYDRYGHVIYEDSARAEREDMMLFILATLLMTVFFPFGAYIVGRVTFAYLMGLPDAIRDFTRHPKHNARLLLVGIPATYYLVLVLPWWIDKQIIGHLVETNAFGGKVADLLIWASQQPLLVQVFVSIDRLL